MPELCPQLERRTRGVWKPQIVEKKHHTGQETAKCYRMKKQSVLLWRWEISANSIKQYKKY